MLGSQTLRGEVASECSLLLQFKAACDVKSDLGLASLQPNSRCPPHARYSDVLSLADLCFTALMLNSELGQQHHTHMWLYSYFVLSNFSRSKSKIILLAEFQALWGLPLSLEVMKKKKKTLGGPLAQAQFNRWVDWGMDKLSPSLSKAWYQVHNRCLINSC